MQNTDYINDYDDRIEFNNGGKVNMKKKGNDRVALAKKCKCGGRKRASIGSEIKTNDAINTRFLGKSVMTNFGGVKRLLALENNPT